MIFVLDIILIVNFYLAYMRFKDFLSPAFLLGAGMLAASIVATCYYGEWKMGDMLPSSVVAIGGGTCLFTFMSYLFPLNKNSRRIISIPVLKEKRLFFVLLFTVVASFLNVVIKYKYYVQTFGSLLSMSELIYSARLDGWTGENALKFPKIVYWISYYSDFLLYISLWLLAYCIVFKLKKKKLKRLAMLHLVIVMLDGFLSGAKGAILEPVFRFFVIYLMLYLSIKKMGAIPRSALLKILGLFIIFIMSFKFLSTSIGRQTEETDNSSMLAEYCGAEIKNFDIYMHGLDGNPTSKRWGEYTFVNFYKEVSPNFKHNPGNFQSVGSITLGNVYTMFFQFHKDFGMIGVFLMTMLIAVISSFIYMKAKHNESGINIFLLIYSSLAFCLVMGFFSSRFTELFFTMYYLKFLVFMLVLTKVANKYLIKGNFVYE